MELNPDLVRDLLLWAERELPSNSGVLEFPTIQGYDEELVSYHCLLADEACFFVSTKFETLDDPFEQVYPRRLTYYGHQYLETIRDPDIWTKTKQGAAKVGSFSLETLGDLAKGYIKTKIAKETGIEID